MSDTHSKPFYETGSPTSRGSSISERSGVSSYLVRSNSTTGSYTSMHSHASTIRQPSSDAMEANDRDYQATRQKYWKHGFLLPRSVFNYKPIPRLKRDKNNVIGDVDVEFKMEVFTPLADFGPIDNIQFNSVKRSETTKVKDSTSTVAIAEELGHEGGTRPFAVPLNTNDAPKLLDNDASSRGFSGFVEVPRATLKVPKSVITKSGYAVTDGSRIGDWEGVTVDGNRWLPTSDLPKVVYQNFHSIGEKNYVFGGLFTDKFVDFSHLGVPNDVDPVQISIKLQCDLPPHIDKEIIMNPYMVHNPHFYCTDKANGILNYMDLFSGFEHPQICGMTSCKVSKRQVFFFGGFKVVILSTKFIPECNRWEVEKGIEMNHNGYILDTFTSRFLKIQLNSNDGTIIRGRIGGAIAANSRDEWKNMLNKSDVDDVFERTTSHTTNSTPAASFSAGGILPPIDPIDHSINNTSLNQRMQSESPPLRSASSPRPTTVHPHSRRHDDISSEMNTYESEPPTPISIPSLGPLSKTSSILKIESHEYKGSISRMASNTSHSSSKNMVDSVLQKSSKIFHRSHQKTPSQPAIHRLSSNKHTPSPTGSNTDSNVDVSNSGVAATVSSSLVAPNPLSNTYSKQVKQHRSNSNQSSGSSRPTSPIALPTPTIPIKQYLNKIGTEHKQQSSIIPTPASTLTKDERSHRTNSPPLKSATKPPLTKPDFPAYTPSWINNAKPSTQDDEEEEKKVIEDSVSVFIFGGFVTTDPLSSFAPSFIAGDDLFKIILTFRHDFDDFVTFNDLAIAYEVGKYAEGGNYFKGDVWPTPRGYFASALIDVNSNIEGNCNIHLVGEHDLNTISTPVPTSTSMSKLSLDNAIDDDSGDEGDSHFTPTHDFKRTSTPSTTNTNFSKKGLKQSDLFFNGKALLIQGGCNEKYETFSDFYLYVFETGKWQIMTTYVHDYFKSPIKPWEDEDISKLTYENMIKDPALIEAELRACHHQALYYKDAQEDYIFFVGGLTNDYLRKFDSLEDRIDKSVAGGEEKFDVLRLARFQLASTNFFVSRVMILNLQTQTWRFLKYFYDTMDVNQDKLAERVRANPSWINARMCVIGGSCFLSGKTLQMGHGLMVATPEKREDMEKIERDFLSEGILSGAQLVWTFPGL